MYDESWGRDRWKRGVIVLAFLVPIVLWDVPSAIAVLNSCSEFAAGRLPVAQTRTAIVAWSWLTMALAVYEYLRLAWERMLSPWLGRSVPRRAPYPTRYPWPYRVLFAVGIAMCGVALSCDAVRDLGNIL